ALPSSRSAQRFVLATTGDEGWVNYIQDCLLQERKFFHAVMAEVIAQLHRDVLAEARAMLDQALAMRIRGTFQPGANYTLGDVVVLDGGSFIARKDNPGKCPGEGWQLMAKQGQRGVAGPKGERGPTISGWILDRATYRVTPRMSDGSLGPVLELRELFEPSQQ